MLLALQEESNRYRAQQEVRAAAVKRQQEIEDYRTKKGIDQEFVKPDPRTKSTAADGYLYWDDTGERVFPGVEKAPDLPSDVREYNHLMESGLLPEGTTYEKFKGMGRPQTNINMNTGDGVGNVVSKKLAENTGKLWSEYQKAGSEASSMVQDLDILDELIKVAPQGPLVGRMAEMFPGISDAGAAFDSVVKRAAPKLRVEGSGSQSDREFDGFLRSFPALRNRPEANALIAQTLRAKADINIQRAQIVSELQRGERDYNSAQEAITALDRQSIMTPQLQELIDAVSPQRGEDTGTSSESKLMPEVSERMKKYGF